MLPVRISIAYGMKPEAIAQFERMLAQGRDTALLRFSLGSAYLAAGDAALAAQHLERATTLDPHYSAAWKLLGRALTDCGRTEDALKAYESGITAAEAKGDKQAAREMQVFAKRLRNAR